MPIPGAIPDRRLRLERPFSRTATRASRARPAARGMTLVEILVVLALLVGIGGLVGPVFTGSIA